MAIVLGLIEGLTEFLPVSSTGHLILFGEILGFQGPPGKVFEIVIQLGAILAICVLYWRRLAVAARGLVRRDASEWRFAGGILLAFLPAMVLGLAFGHYIKTVLFNPHSVSVALIVGGIVILMVERIKPATIYSHADTLPLSLCFKIGLCQCLALIPGTSRSGATIIGALLLGVERRAAAQFSFFLAIPTMFAATSYDLYKSWGALSLDDMELIALGFLTAFASALVVVRAIMAYLAKHDFTLFAWYRIALGATMLWLLN